MLKRRTRTEEAAPLLTPCHTGVKIWVWLQVLWDTWSSNKVTADWGKQNHFPCVHPITHVHMHGLYPHREGTITWNLSQEEKTKLEVNGLESFGINLSISETFQLQKPTGLSQIYPPLPNLPKYPKHTAFGISNESLSICTVNHNSFYILPKVCHL